jgi:hypothetical protein
MEREGGQNWTLKGGQFWKLIDTQRLEKKL